MSPVDRANRRPMTGFRAIRDRTTIRDRDMDKAGYAVGRWRRDADQLGALSPVIPRCLRSVRSASIVAVRYSTFS
jgi:hypothetical protein